LDQMIPFNKASFSQRELELAQLAIREGHTSGNGPLTKRAEAMLSEMHDGSRALLTTSCTHALEMSARLIGLQPGDEVIVPAYTFVSTASAFAWNGAKPVFADIDPDTLNIDPKSVESLITDRTRAICIVHYAGVGAQPDVFRRMADEHNLILIEDNAHGLGGRWDGRLLGTFGSMSTLSFHETKNITCGEGGALILNDPILIERAEILREKGTDRSRFLRGQVDKYTWVDLGSSWVLSDILAGLLVGQLERFDEIQDRRLGIWNSYFKGLSAARLEEGIRLPSIPPSAEHPAHMFALRMASREQRDLFIAHMRAAGIHTVFHYQALDVSPYGQFLTDRQGKALPHSSDASDQVVRLPLHVGLSEHDVASICEAVSRFQVR